MAGVSGKRMKQTWNYLELERTGRTLLVRFQSPNAVNSLSYALMRELTELAVSLQEDSELNAIILTGTPTTFSAGMDLKDPESAGFSSLTQAQKRKLVQVGPRMCAAWEAIEPVTIAAIEGWCIGGGMALVSACDWRVAANDARLYVPELKLGMNMSWQSVPRFVSLIGPAKTKELLIIAEPVSAQQAHAWGLVDHLVANGKSLEKARELADKVAQRPPIPVRMAKQAINTSANTLNHATSFMDADQFLLAIESEDAREGAMAFFEKRPPTFKGN
jgi:enoyl-CoA hydratase/carnithine racemase